MTLGICSERLVMALTFVRGLRVLGGFETAQVVRSLAPSNTAFDAGYHFVEHHLARQPTVHCLCGIESSGLKQLVGGRSAAAPAEVTATVLASLDASADFVVDSPERRCALDIGEPVHHDLTQCKSFEPGVACAQELR